MNALGIYTGLDLRCQSLEFLAEHFSKAGSYYRGMARGQDNRPVEGDRLRKSGGAETMFDRDLQRWDEVLPAVEPVFVDVWAACSRGGYCGRTVTANIKHAYFHQRMRDGASLTPQYGVRLLRYRRGVKSKNPSYILI